MMQLWDYGMDVRALIYCIDSTFGTFKSMMVVLGHSGVKDDTEIKLLKHGGPGGKCKRWSLNDEDYIERIEYMYDREFGYVSSVRFLTEQGQTRTIGKDWSGRKRRIVYTYN